MPFKIGDRIRLRSLPDALLGGWLHDEEGNIETLLAHERCVVKLDQPITQNLAISLGYTAGFAVVRQGNLFPPDGTDDSE